SVAVFILLAATAGARIIPTYLLLVPNGLGALYVAGVFHRSTAACSHQFGFGCFYPCLLPGYRSCLPHVLGLLLGDFSLEQKTNDVLVHLDQHIPEQVEGLHLIDNNGV